MNIPEYIREDVRAAEIYENTAKELGRGLSYTDCQVMGILAKNLSRWEELSLWIDEHGEIATDDRGNERRHPKAINAAKAFDQYQKSVEMLGLTRKQRAKVDVKKPGKAVTKSLRKEPRSVSI